MDICTTDSILLPSDLRNCIVDLLYLSPSLLDFVSLWAGTFGRLRRNPTPNPPPLRGRSGSCFSMSNRMEFDAPSSTSSFLHYFCALLYPRSPNTPISCHMMSIPEPYQNRKKPVRLSRICPRKCPDLWNRRTLESMRLKVPRCLKDRCPGTSHSTSWRGLSQYKNARVSHSSQPTSCAIQYLLSGFFS